MCLLAMIILSPSLSVFAAEYNMVDNSVTGIDGNTYRTVMITKEDDGSIVYIGQANGETTYTSAMTFYLKNGLDDGYYIMKLGGKEDGTERDVVRFYIGSASEYGDAQYSKSWLEDGSAAFAWESIDNISDYKSVLFEVGSKVFGLDLTGFENIDGAVNLGVEITEIPDGTIISNAYLSTNDIAGSTLIQ